MSYIIKISLFCLRFLILNFSHGVILLKLGVILVLLLFLYNKIWTSVSVMFILSMRKMSFIIMILTLVVLVFILKRRIVFLKERVYLNNIFIFRFYILIIFFCVESLVLFYCFFEISLIPIFFLVIGWGYQPERVEASMWILIYTLVSSIPLILIILVYQEQFFIGDFFSLTKVSLIMNRLRIKIFLNFFLRLGFLVKFPMFFLHMWLPRAHVEAPLIGSILLAAVLLKLAGFGMLKLLVIFSRFIYLDFIQMFCLVGGSMVSVVCCYEKDIKKIIAYTSVSHISFVISRILTKRVIGVKGALLLIISHGICSSALFIGAMIIYKYSNSRSILFNYGYLSVVPFFRGFWFLMCLGNIGGPPTPNFFSEVFCLIRFLSLNLMFLFPIFFLTFLRTGYSIVLYTSTQYFQYSNYKIVKLFYIDFEFMYINSVIIFVIMVFFF